jgi:hypothetical protein
MKKLLLILLCLPLIGLGQGIIPEQNKCISGNCENGFGELEYYIEGAADLDIVQYEGEFKDGKFNGEGNITCNFGGFEGESGYFYIQGNWKNGKLNGNAITILSIQRYLCDLEEWGSTYTTLLQEDVYKYSGEYIDSLRDGFGFMTISTFVYEDENIGQFTDTPEMTTYIGHWKNDEINGFGRYFYPNGNIYEGEWQDNLRHGKGLMIYNDGSIENGIWEDDKYIGK